MHKLIKYIKVLNANDRKVNNICMDNVGENIHELKYKLEEMVITVELAAPYMPQQNGVVERIFDTDKSRSASMLICSRFTEGLIMSMWEESVSTSEKLVNLCVNENPKITIFGI